MPDPLSDEYPVLLGPVRIETRFTADELLVRIFPDEWQIDSSEPQPSEAEFAALTAYWTALWRAAGDPAGEEEAWRELSGRVAPGRALWLRDELPPANPGEKPAHLPAGTTVLVITTAAALPAADRRPTADYWTAVWRAHGDRARIVAADAALLAAVGAARARAVRGRPPTGVEAAPSRTSDAVVVAFLVVPRPERVGRDSWTRAARAGLLPDRFTVLGWAGDALVVDETGADVPDGLAVSPDPGATGGQLKVDEEHGTLNVPDDLRWLTEFRRAVDVGMGLRIGLDDRSRGGLDRLLVLGLRRRQGPEASAGALAGLITRQLRSPAGFGLVPQGTPTNNTERDPAGPGAQREAAAGLRAAAAAAGLRADTGADPGDWTTRTDGRWLTDLLGLDPAVLAGVPHADGTDLRDARAANTALWPATWGDFLRTALSPVLSEEDAERTRAFFVRYVSGRGPLPVVRIGRQPYGILPTTSFERIQWPAGATGTHRAALHGVLEAMAADWTDAVSKVARLDAGSADPHQRLLDILALHPTSAEYHQRYARSVADLYNQENLAGRGPAVTAALEDPLHMPQPVRALLARLGYDARPPGGPARPDPELTGRLFEGTPYPLLGPLVDDLPLSEDRPPRPCTPPPERLNYLGWLARYGRTDLDRIRLEDGFAGARPPAALLYLLLRHSVLLGWEEAAWRLAAAAGQSPAPITDPPFVHIRSRRDGEAADPPSESRYRRLYAPDRAVTGSTDPAMLVHRYVPQVLGTHPATARLDEQLRAIGLLADVPTARLDRVLAEHLDLATHRLDAWRLALAGERLAEMRYGPGGGDGPGATARRGIHLGCYGWLYDVRPRKVPLAGHTVPPELVPVFGTDPVSRDPDNGGYVHAPSPAQARTAAVLRAGYLANGAQDATRSFAVNLSSERVRDALTVLDGLREGQSLGALLGYRFERGLHERRLPDGSGLDRFLPALRGAFPLRAGRLSDVTPGPGVPVEVVEARTVVDGLELVRRATRDHAAAYPFGAEHMPAASADESTALDAELRRLLHLHDALADLAVAEAAHQALSGNTERASATLDAYAKEGLPPDPEVVATPRSGVTLTHRFGIQLTPGLAVGHLPPLYFGDGPRAKAEPAVNDWLPALLPAQQDLAALVTWTDPVSGEPRSRVVTMHDLRLQPIDLLWAVRPAGEAGKSDLDDRIIGIVVEEDRPRPDAELSIRYTRRVPDKISFFEVAPLVDALRTLLTTARPLRPTDLMAAAGPAGADRSADEEVSLPRERPDAVRADLAELGRKVTEQTADLTRLYPAAPAQPDREEVIGRIDALLARCAELTATAGGFGMVRSGWTELTEWRRGIYAGVLAAVAVAAKRMGTALLEADRLLSDYDTLPSGASDEERFRLLEAAERLLTTSATRPRPDRPALLWAIVRNRREAFRRRLADLEAVARTTQTTLSGLLAALSRLLPIGDVDPVGLDLTPFHDAIVAYGRELLERSLALGREIDARTGAADRALEACAGAVTGPDRVRAATDALRALLGPDVLVVPEFTPSEDLAAQWRRARADSAALTSHLETDFGRDFPVDDWVHGIARVREKPRLWEKAVLLGDALRGPGGPMSDAGGWQEPLLTPVQLPYRTGDHWLAMEFKAGTEIKEDRVLFTAHCTPEPLIGTERCGLLFDEWTEVVPTVRETTGIAVHYDRPGSEPPQAMLLVVPPVRTGAWREEDLVAAVTETFGLARARAVEPAHLEGLPYAQLLPATVLPAARQPITLTTDLALCNLRGKADD